MHRHQEPRAGSRGELTPPAGTETILLLAGYKPMTDVEGFIEQCCTLGSPRLEGMCLFTLDENGPRITPSKTERPIGSETVRCNKGFLDVLLERVPEDWGVVQALAFPLRE